MPSNPKTAHANDSTNPSESLIDLGRGLLEQLAAASGGVVPADAAVPEATEFPPVRLHLGDLVADANNEVVLYNDSGLSALTLTTDTASVVARGVASAHVTATGENVAGFGYLTFDNGVTLYYEHGLDILLAT